MERDGPSLNLDELFHLVEYTPNILVALQNLQLYFWC